MKKDNWREITKNIEISFFLIYIYIYIYIHICVPSNYISLQGGPLRGGGGVENPSNEQVEELHSKVYGGLQAVYEKQKRYAGLPARSVNGAPRRQCYVAVLPVYQQLG